MKQRLGTVFVLVGILAAAATVTLSAASAEHATAAPLSDPPNAVLTWNTYAVNAVRASSPSKFQVEGLIYMSYVQAAVYDAVTKMEGRYVPYHDFIATVVPGASVQAAVAAAAQTTLDNYLPDQKPTVDAEYNAYLATLSGDVADGVAVGQAAANDVIALRTGDGRNAATPTYGTIGPILPGQWQLQSPGQTAQTPWVATMRPFLLQQASQFRVGPPPALTSEQYAKDLNETEAYGAVDSTVRTPDETATAYFWNANAVNQYNGTMQNAITENGLDLVDAAHLFAMGELTTADAGIACWDSKYFYLAWRPITAIQHADLDGNQDTTADPTWQPLVATPAHPEYPSAHGCLTAALTDALAAALHTDQLDITIPGATGGGTTLTTSRQYGNVQDIQNEIVNARVWIGFHFRNSVEQGENLGNDVAAWDLNQAFQPTTINGNVTCTNDTYNGWTINGNVVVPDGDTCTLTASTVKGNVQVEGGSGLADSGSTIGGNLQADGSAWVDVRGGSIHGNLQVESTTGSTPASVGDGSTANDLCGTSVDGNVQVQNNGAAAPFDVGGAPDCTEPLTVGGNLQVQGNAGELAIAGSSVHGNIQVQNNTGGGTLTGNSAGSNCQLQNNHPGVAGSGNIAAHQNTCNATA